jgi:amino acid permease
MSGQLEVRDSYFFPIVLIFVLNVSKSDLCIGSRIVYGLSVERKVPCIFAKVNCTGVSGRLRFLNVSSLRLVFGSV